MAPSTREHYAKLFAQLVRECGPLSPITRMAILGFAGGGPVSIIQVGTGEHYVTCELSLYPGQQRSSEGLKFELFSRLDLPWQASQALLTAMGAMSMEEQLGDLHTVTVGEVVPEAKVGDIQLRLFSRCQVGDDQFGIYEICHRGHDA